MFLGDAFGEAFKESYADSKLEVGNIIFAPYEGIDHLKFHVIIGVTADKIMVGNVFINSEINGNFNQFLEQVHRQIKITPAEYDFLDHESYIDCNRLKEVDYQSLHKYVSENPKSIKDTLKPEHIDLVFGMLSDSPTISPKQRRKYDIQAP